MPARLHRVAQTGENCGLLDICGQIFVRLSGEAASLVACCPELRGQFRGTDATNDAVRWVDIISLLCDHMVFDPAVFEQRLAEIIIDVALLSNALDWLGSQLDASKVLTLNELRVVVHHSLASIGEEKLRMQLPPVTAADIILINTLVAVPAPVQEQASETPQMATPAAPDGEDVHVPAPEALRRRILASRIDADDREVTTEPAPITLGMLMVGGTASLWGPLEHMLYICSGQGSSPHSQRLLSTTC